MNSTEIKVALLSYCRFARQYHYVATEVSMPGDSLADVVASDGKNLVEYEIKISMSDLRADFGKFKHFIYDMTPITWTSETTAKKKNRTWEIKKDPESRWGSKLEFIYEDGRKTSWGCSTVQDAKEVLERNYGPMKGGPNMMYYVMPKQLWEDNKEKILGLVPDIYGIISCGSQNFGSLSVERKAKKLHKEEVSSQKLRTIVARMSSEIAGLTMMHYNYTQKMTEFGQMLQDRYDLAELKAEGENET